MFRGRFSLLVWILTSSFLSIGGRAQKVDAAFTVGVASASDAKVSLAGICLAPCSGSDTFETDKHVFFAGTGAVRLANFKVVSLHLEVPVASVPSAGLTEVNAFGVRSTGGHISSLFVTPALRLKLAPKAAVSPFVSAGGGWARYKFDFSDSLNKTALQFGGGVDFKSGYPFLAFRAEVRDFVTGQPDFVLVAVAPPGSRTVTSTRHNVLAGGGVVVHF